MADKHCICLLNDSFPPVIDGVSNTVTNYAYEIERKYGRAVVATPDFPGADDSAFPFPVVRYPSLDTRELVGYVAGFPFSPELAMRLEKEKVSLLHSHCPIASTLLARTVRETMDVPLVLTYHTMFDLEISKAIHSEMLRGGALDALIANISACDEVWAVSRGAGESLRNIGYDGEIIVMENGVDLPRSRVGADAVHAVTGGYDLPEGVPVFLFVGRLVWYKGIRMVLDALKSLKERGIDFRMVFVGGGGEESEVKEYTSALRLDDKVIFAGPVSDREALRAWYCRSDLFLFPSTFDTYGLVVREAAACSLASVLVKGSCAAEDVTDGRNGFLIDENAEALAGLLTELHDKPDVLKRVGETAADELYISWEDSIARANERYGIVIENHRAGKYKQHTGLTDGLFMMTGMLMEMFGQIEEFKNDVNDLFEKWVNM